MGLVSGTYLPYALVDRGRHRSGSVLQYKYYMLSIYDSVGTACAICLILIATVMVAMTISIDRHMLFVQYICSLHLLKTPAMRLLYCSLLAQISLVNNGVLA